MIFTTKQTGDKGEAYAAKYLKKHKYKIIARNYKKPYGEIAPYIIQFRMFRFCSD